MTNETSQPFGIEMRLPYLIEIGHSVAEALVRELGYNEANFRGLEYQVPYYGVASYVAKFYVEDDFQEHLSYDDRVDHGSMAITIEQLTSFPAGFQSREMRELKSLAKRTALGEDYTDKMESALAKQFVADLMPDLEKLKNLLTKD